MTTAQELAGERDELNTLAAKLIEQANDCCARRDRLNQEVSELKAERDRLNAIAARGGNKLANATSWARGEEQSLPELKRELKKLEECHMTSVLSLNQERGLISQMRGVKKKIEKILEQGKLSEARTELGDAREQATKLHKTIEEKAENARLAHEEMVQLYDKAHEVQERADTAHKAFVEKMQEES